MAALLSACAVPPPVVPATTTPFPTPAPTPTPGLPVTLQFLTFSGWHAQLEPFTLAEGGNVGGAAAIAAYWKADRVANPNTLALSSGDSFGASPSIASFFNEEPAVKTLNLMGLDADTLGNHNFDKGVNHLQSMADLAKFTYVFANLKNAATALQNAPSFKAFTVGGVNVAAIGLTNAGAAPLVAPGNFGVMEVTDPAAGAAKALVAARNAGAQVFVLAAHLGVSEVSATGEPSGPIIDIAKKVPGFDLIIAD